MAAPPEPPAAGGPPADGGADVVAGDGDAGEGAVMD
jgi:hypothetical protein